MRRIVLPLAALALLGTVALGDAYDDLVEYDWAQGRGPLAPVEQDIRDATTPEARKAVEAKLLEALAHPQATYACKQFVCRMLRRVGSSASVDPLAALLTDEKLSHMARFALQHSPAPEATDALRGALGKVQGKLKVGMVTSLGERGDPEAVSALAPLVEAPDPVLARAAIHALGRIASPEAAEALARASVAGGLRTEWADATLACADQMLDDGQQAEAAAVYRKLFAKGNPRMIRIAALRGIVMAEQADAVPLLLKLMRGDHTELAKAATRFAIEVPGDAATRALAEALTDMPPDGQLLLLDALTERDDPAAAPAVKTLLDSREEEVRVAAVRALGTIGDANCVAPLARLAAKGGRTGDAATDSLNRLKGKGVAAAMSQLLDSPEAALRAGILGVLATRADRSMAPVMLKAARDKEADVRKAAIKGLEATAGPEELPDLVSLLLEAERSSERAGLEKAIAAAARRSTDLDARAEPIVAGLPRAEPEVQVRLLSVLSRLGGEKALEAVRGQLDADDADVATAAVRALQDWPDASPAADLLRIIQTTKDPVRKVLAFRGYVRMANLVAAESNAEAMAMYRKALDLATTVAERKSVLSGVAQARTVEALDLVEPLLDDPAVRAEAQLAMVQIARNAHDTGPTKARAALKEIVAATTDKNIRKQAQQVINEIDKTRGYIRTWLGAGPYVKGDSFKTAYPPEKDGEGVEWALLTKGVGPQIIDLERAVGRGDHRAAYMKTHVWSPVDQDVQLQIGSDDAVKAWVNHKLVHVNNANRPCKLNQDQAKAHLDKGWNRVMVKIVDNSGDWAFCLRIVRPDGSLLDGLRVSAEKQQAAQ
ncbi:MAG: HEAT repeat domain-containing protein [Planctomycetota bacterium]